jgi:hypothetical protein
MHAKAFAAVFIGTQKGSVSFWNFLELNGINNISGLDVLHLEL